MKKEIADQWVAALRSGKYERAEGNLRYVPEERVNEKPTYCCLGVLTDLFLEETGEGWWSEGCEDINACSYMQTDEEGRFTEREDSTVPKNVMRWSGLKNKFGAIGLYVDDEGSEVFTLAGLNDAGHTFNQLAATIEINWETL